jgi:nucleotide-binding universal stress UspA family protein
MSVTPTPGKIIIGTTLGEASDQVVATGARIARAIGATTHLVNAFEEPLLLAPGPYLPAVYENPLGPRELAAAGREAMEDQIARLRLAGGAAIVKHVEEGPAHRVLGEVARRERADLIVVGAADIVGAHVFGSTASRVVRKARCPVLVLRGELPIPPRRVLMPVDLSPISDEVVTRGLVLLDRLAAAYPGAEQHDGIAVEALYVLVPMGWEGFVPHLDLDGAVRAAADKLGDFLSPHRRDGWQIERRAAFGGAREEILGRIEATAPDLVVMGTHGLSGFERFLLGSVAEGVMRGCRTSVLVIHPKWALATATAARERASARERQTPGALPAGAPAQPAA